MQSDRETPKGITRINITGSKIRRVEDAKKMWEVANGLYNRIFVPDLSPGYHIINCTKQEFEAGYDMFLGIDVLLSFKNGMTLAMQEKFLMTKFHTVTVEYYNDPLINDTGDWFDLKAQLYFVGYCNPRFPEWGFREWALLDWVQVVLQTQAGNIDWEEQGNTNSYAKATFKHVRFDKIPECCILASKIQKP